MEKEKNKSALVVAIIIIILLVAILITMILTTALNGKNIFSRFLNNESVKTDESKTINKTETEVAYTKSKELFSKFVESYEDPFITSNTEGFSELTDAYKIRTAISTIKDKPINYDKDGLAEGYSAEKVMSAVEKLYPNSSIDKTKEENKIVGIYSYNEEYDAYTLHIGGFEGVSSNNVLDKVVETNNEYILTFYRIEGELGYENPDPLEPYDTISIETKEYYKEIAKDNYDEKKLATENFKYKINGEVSSEDLINIVKEHKDVLPKIKYTITKDGSNEYLTKIELVD